MALHVPIGPLKKTALGWSRYRYANPLPTSPVADDIGTAPLEPVDDHQAKWRYLPPITECLKTNQNHYTEGRKKMFI